MTNGGDGTEDLLRSVLNTLIQRIRVLRTQAPSLVPSVRDRVRADAQRFLPNGQGVVDGLDCTLDGAGLRLKRLRRRRGIMPADLAAETGVSASSCPGSKRACGVRRSNSSSRSPARTGSLSTTTSAGPVDFLNRIGKQGERAHLHAASRSHSAITPIRLPIPRSGNMKSRNTASVLLETASPPRPKGS